MSLKADATKRIAEDARFYMLKELASQTDGRMSIYLLREMLDASYAINRTLPWVEQQLRYLEELGALGLMTSGALIASIMRTGRDHLEERAALVGVTPPHRFT